MHAVYRYKQNVSNSSVIYKKFRDFCTRTSNIGKPLIDELVYLKRFNLAIWAI